MAHKLHPKETANMSLTATCKPMACTNVQTLSITTQQRDIPLFYPRKRLHISEINYSPNEYSYKYSLKASLAHRALFLSQVGKGPARCQTNGRVRRSKASVEAEPFLRVGRVGKKEFLANHLEREEGCTAEKFHHHNYRHVQMQANFSTKEKFF